MAVFGYGRGSLSKAAEEAFARWCAEHDGPTTAQASEAERESIAQITQGINPDELSHEEEKRGPIEETSRLDRAGNAP